MKNYLQKITLLIACLVAVNQSFAQLNFIGTNREYGGFPQSHSNGTLFSYKPVTNIIENLNYFEYDNEVNTLGSEAMIDGGNGMYYGVVESGGDFSAGAIFEYNPITNKYKQFYRFTYSGSGFGQIPVGGLVKGTDGKLYGMCSSGFQNGFGGIFVLDLNYKTLTSLYAFTQARAPQGSLLEAETGVFYGLSRTGGSNNHGTFFKFDTNNNAFTDIYSFLLADKPEADNGGLILASNNKIYALCSGAASHYGKIMEYNLATSTLNFVYDFNSAPTQGSYPKGKLVQATNGKLYGVTQNGGTDDIGVLFQFDPTISSYTNLYSFSLVAKDGANPKTGLIEVSANKLFGVAEYGGNDNVGAIFSFDVATSSYTVTHHLPSSSTPVNYIKYPRTGLAFSNNKIYACSRSGSVSGNGGIYEFDITNSTKTDKIFFGSSEKGRNPSNYPLLKTSNNKVYGTTSQGGLGSQGALYEFDLITKDYKTLYSFRDNWSGTNYGYRPEGGVQQAANGNLYGCANNGGTNGGGVLYEYNLTTSSYTVIHNFYKFNWGNLPYFGALTTDANNKLYGSTYVGGTNGGVIFSYDLNTSSYTVLHNFENATGVQPFSQPTMGPDGKLYGATNSGGANGNGVIYQFDPTGAGSYTVLQNLSFATGYTSYCSFVFVDNNKFYGTMYSGGINSQGVLFEYNLATNVYTTKYSFYYSSGANPKGSLLARDGYIWGTTGGGGYGSNPRGVIYKYDYVNNIYEVKQTFVEYSPNGYSPEAGLIDYCETPAANVSATQNICKNNATIADLSATGTDIKWYDAQTGGNLLTSVTTLTNNTTYYVAQNIEGCEGPRTAVLVTANPVPNTNVQIKGNKVIATETGASYKWLDCNNNFTPISGATLQTYTVDVAGSFALEITKNGCVATGNCIDFDVTGIESENESSFSVYPNPNKGVFTIQSQDLNSDYVLMDVSGKIVKQDKLTSNKTEVKISDLEPGIYFLQTNNKVTKIVKY